MSFKDAPISHIYTKPLIGEVGKVELRSELRNFKFWISWLIDTRDLARRADPLLLLDF